MEFKTKFNLGDRVYFIESAESTTTHVCKVCSGEGQLETYNKEFVNCYYCDGDGEYITGRKKVWTVHEDELEISAIRMYFRAEITEEICVATTVGDWGWREGWACLFFTSKEEAHAECEKKNKGL